MKPTDGCWPSAGIRGSFLQETTDRASGRNPALVTLATTGTRKLVLRNDSRVGARTLYIDVLAEPERRIFGLRHDHQHTAL